MTVIDLRKEITINSPAGSGNMFCQFLMEENFHMRLRWVNHNPDLFDKNGINIFILRNPYDCVASGVEVGFYDMNKDQKKYAEKDIDFFINESIAAQVDTYNLFLKSAQGKEYITPVGFRLLTEQPDIFLDKVSKKFDLPFKDNRVSAEDVKVKMKSVPNIGIRLPRESTSFRAQINKAIKEYPPIKICYNKYVEYKKSIDLHFEDLLEG